MSSPCHPAPPCWQQGHSKPSQAQLRSSQQPRLTPTSHLPSPAPERANRQDFEEMKPGEESKAVSPLETLVEPKPVASSGSARSWSGPGTLFPMPCPTQSWKALNLPRANPAFLLVLGSSTWAMESTGVALQGCVTPHLCPWVPAVPIQLGYDIMLLFPSLLPPRS